MLIIISAPSGAGKTTLCQRLLQEFGDRLRLSISCTTRQPRKNESNGREYFFLSESEFKQRIDQGDFAEWALVHGHYYGTSRSTIQNCFSNGVSVLLDIDVQGAASLRTAFPQDYYSIFVSPPSLEELEFRLRSRGTEDEATLRRRIENARSEMLAAREFDLVVVNDKLEKAYQEISSAVSQRIAPPKRGA